MLLRVSKLSFAFDGQPALFDKADITFTAGWTGIVGRNGSGKTTLLRLLLGELIPEKGAVEVCGVQQPLLAHCAQNTSEPPYGLATFLESLDTDAVRLRADLQVAGDWKGRWHTLSHGERKRLQVGITLHASPDVLLLDEPTNHVDAQTRAFLMRALSRFKGIGLMVSHDRVLLDGLCTKCLFLDPPRSVLRPGTYTQAREQEQRETQTLMALAERTKHELARCAEERARRQREASQADRKRSKRHLDKHDSDGRARIDRARVSGKDGQAGRLARQLDAKVTRAHRALEETHVDPHYDTHLSFIGERAPRRWLLSMPAGELPLGQSRRLTHPALTLSADDRIAIVGRNGSGKSTLVRKIVDTLTIAPERVVYLPQELDLNRQNELRALWRLSREERGRVLSIVSCLGSRPEPILNSQSPSPGELRKLALAHGVAKGAWFLVMDEPTNHLDLASVECLEQALLSYRGAVLLVSHDDRFLQRVAQRVWQLEDAPGGTTLKIR